MSPSAYVDQAVQYQKKLVQREIRGPNDIEPAMRRIETKYGVPFSTLWVLRYRPPKRIWADVLDGIRMAYEAQKQEQIRRLRHETEITEIVAGSNSSAVRAAKALVGEDVGKNFEED